MVAKTKLVPLSQKQKFTKQLIVAARAKKEKTRQDIISLMQKAGYSTASSASVSQWFDVYSAARAAYAVVAEDVVKLKAEIKLLKTESVS